MGKNEFLTPKAIANRIKAKGLQKLRWYCQMCQKQCRDENGFKCHCMSESHQRQMQVFGHNPERFVDGFSEKFEECFLEHVKRTHRFSRVAATVVYNEYINDRHHVHMNSTEWTTLTDFIKHLGRTGQCKVEETPKGWFMTYIDREPETLLKEGLQKKRERAELADEERHERALEDQIERASKMAKPIVEVEEEKRLLQRDEGNGEKIAFVLPKGASSNVDSGGLKGGTGTGGNKASVGGLTSGGMLSFFNDEDETLGKNGNGKERKESHGGKESNDSKQVNGRGDAFSVGKNGRGTLDDMMYEQERAKERSNRKDYWLCEGIVVKVMSKALQEKGYYKQKGVVQKVVSKYVAEIKMIDSGHVLRIDQQELETVLPQIGGFVRIVNGAYRDSNAKLMGINTEEFSAKVQIEKGAFDGRVLPNVQYEDICKLATA